MYFIQPSRTILSRGRESRFPRRLLLVSVFAAQFLLAPAAEAIKGFEDLPWGSRPEQIEEKFGEIAVREDEVCDDPVATANLAEQGEDCLTIVIDHYFANGIDFSASFRFDAQHGGLRMIVLKTGLKSKNLSPRAVRQVFLECRQTFDKLTRRLTTEFGLPNQTGDTQPEPTFTKADFKAWTTEGTGVWMRNSYGYTDHWKRWRKGDGCEIELRFFSIPSAGPVSAPAPQS